MSRRVLTKPELEARHDRFFASTSPPIGFRIYPAKGKSRSRLFFRAMVWPEQRTMHRFLRVLRHQRDIEKSMMACCLELNCYKTSADGSRRKRKNIGELHFYSDQFDAELTTHEVTHAAFVWARRVGLDISVHSDHDGARVHPNEERFVESVGFMMSQLAWQAYRLKLWKKVV